MADRALGSRFAQWCTIVDSHGYILLRPYDLDNQSVALRLELRANRNSSHGGPSVDVVIRELWLPGIDPLALVPAFAGFHLHRASWHAQVGGLNAVDAERLDIDRRKQTPLALHRHPLGQPNTVREPTSIATPEAWMAHLETLVSRMYTYQDGAD